MTMLLPSVRKTFAICLLSLAASCAANTPYRGVPVANLSDEELITELQAAVQGLGIQLNRTMYLMRYPPRRPPKRVVGGGQLNLGDRGFRLDVGMVAGGSA